MKNIIIIFLIFIFFFMVVSSMYAQTISADSLNNMKNKAEQGLADAQYCLGVCYNNGQGVPKDLDKAVYWYEKAAKQGFPEAKEQLQRLQR